MVSCKICKADLVSMKALSQHIRNHKVKSEEYYNQFIKTDESEGICKECKKPTKFKSLTTGYQKFCGLKCSNNNKERIKEFQKSYKQNNMTEVKAKRERTNLKLYGNKIANRNPEIKEKTKQRVIEKFGVDNAMKIPSIAAKAADTKRNDFIKSNLVSFLSNRSLELIGPFMGAHQLHLFKCKVCDTEFENIWNYIQQGTSCPTCSTQNGPSKYEKEIVYILKNAGLNVVENTRKIISPKELDIFLPDLNIAIEFNGLYWHSNENKSMTNPSTYHLDKLNECIKKDINLIQIFEDEWLFNKELVIQTILHKIGKSNSSKIHGRKCLIKEIDSKTKNSFLRKFHLQGADTSKIKLGAFFNNELVAVMTFSAGNISKGSTQKDGIWELNRFCTNFKYRIPGIASKLLTHFKRNYNWFNIFSYADRRWSSGNVYEALNFNLSKTTIPNYWYIKNYRRIHRFNLRKTNADPKNIPEWLLRENDGYWRIWDCGHLKYEIGNL